MSSKINARAESPMDTQLLQAIHNVEKNTEVRFARLETKIDDSVNGRFKDHERRIAGIEANIKWLAIAIIGPVIVAIMSLVLK